MDLNEFFFGYQTALIRADAVGEHKGRRLLHALADAFAVRIGVLQLRLGARATALIPAAAQ